MSDVQKTAHRFFYYVIRKAHKIKRIGKEINIMKNEQLTIEEIAAQLALDRPGLEELRSEYIKNKNNPENVKYECPELEPILSSTYGCIIFHQQIERILSSLGGFSPEQSNLARRNMGKRKTSVREKDKHDFVYGNPETGISGCVANGISAETAEKIFDDMWKVGGLTFNMACAMEYVDKYYQKGGFCE